MNRFNQPVQNAGYTPLSFQELAFAPIQMRQREDRMNDQKDLILNQMHNTVGYEGFDEETNAAKAEMQGRLEKLAGDIQSNGAGNMNYMNEFRNIRNDYNKLVSKTGTLGMSSALKENLDTQKAAFYKMGLANGQSPQAIEDNWQKEVSGYTSQLPDSLSKMKGQLPNFTPKLPPKKEDLAVHATRMKGLMGSIEDKYGEVTYEMEEDPATGESRMVVRNNQGQELTNEPNINKFKEYMEMELLNPGSALRQDMEFNGESVEDMIAKVDLLGDIMLTQKSSEQTEIKSQGSGGGSGSRGSSGSSDTPEIGTGTLVEARGTAAEKVANSQSTKDIMNSAEAIKRDPELTPEEREKQLTTLRQAYRLKSKTENTPEFQNAMNEQIANNEVLKKNGINNWSDYREALNNPEFQKPIEQDNVAIGQVTGGYNNSGEISKMQVINSQVNKLYDNVENNNPILAQQQLYTFGTGETDKKIQKQLGETFNPLQLKSMLAHNQVQLFNGETDDPIYENVENGDDNHQMLMDAMASGDVKYTFEALNSGSEMSSPELLYQMEVGTGDDKQVFNISVDLEDNGYGQELLDPESDLYNSLDDDGRNVIDAINDNLEYRGLPTHSLEMDQAGEIYNPRKSTAIKAMSQKKTEEQFGGYKIQSRNNPSDLDQEFLDAMFIKDDGFEYGVRVNDDGSYSTYKSEPGSGREIPFTFGDYMEKEIMASFAKEHQAEYVRDKSNKKWTYENLTGEAGRIWKDKMKVQALNTIVAVGGNIDDLENNLITYNKSKGFMDAINEWYQIKGKNIPEQEKIAKAREVYDKIKGYKVSSKRKKMVL